jgi:hypothetical protein
MRLVHTHMLCTGARRSLLSFVLLGSDRHWVLERRRDVRIAHIGELDAAEASVFARDFRKRSEQKSAHASL